MYSYTLLPQHPKPFSTELIPTGHPSLCWCCSCPGAGPAFAFVGFPKVPLCPSLPPVLVPLKGCTALRGSATPPNLSSPGTSLRSHQPHRLSLSCSSSQLTSSLLCFSPFQLFCLLLQSKKIRKNPGGFMPNYAGVLQRA